MLREFGFHRYGFHVLYGGHNAIPHNNVTILREVNSYSIPHPAGGEIGRSGVTKLKRQGVESICSGAQGVPFPAVSLSSPMLRDCLLPISRQES